MKNKLKFTCPGCKAEGTLDFPIEAEGNAPLEIHVKEAIHTTTPCPACGAHLSSWPSGIYKPDGNGFMVRVGEFTGIPPKATSH